MAAQVKEQSKDKPAAPLPEPPKPEFQVDRQKVTQLQLQKTMLPVCKNASPFFSFISDFFRDSNYIQMPCSMRNMFCGCISEQDSLLMLADLPTPPASFPSGRQFPTPLQNLLFSLWSRQTRGVQTVSGCQPHLSWSLEAIQHD